MKEKGIEPKLRSYNPALQAFCDKKSLAEARAGGGCLGRVDFLLPAGIVANRAKLVTH